MAAPPLPRLLLLAVGAAAAAAAAGDGCTAGCDLALGSYTYLAGLIPFLLSRGQTYSSIANNYYNLTTADWLQKTNTYPPNNTPDTGTVNVTVNCSCGDASASPDYGLFLTYPLRDGETLTSAAVNNGFSSPSQMDLLRKYKPGMDSVIGRGIVYIPVKAGGGGQRPSGERRRLARRRTRRTHAHTPAMVRRWQHTCHTHAHRRHARRRTHPPLRGSGRWPAGVRRRHAWRCMRPPWRGSSGRRPAGARWRHTRPHARTRARAHGFAGRPAGARWRHTRPHARTRARAHGFAGPGKGAPVGAIAGGAVAGVVALVLGVLVYIMLYRRRKAKEATLLPSSEDSTQPASTLSMDEVTPSTTQAPDGASPVAGITVDKLVEFSYQELFNATEGFSIGNKIGQGGFGSVYYAELRGEKAAIKKMDMQATHEFLAELKVLTHVHHLNLVRLIGYCIESSLFLVYEFIENSNLSQHLRGTGYEPLSWAARVQIGLDSARGLEYIHEHTVPVYVHRDIKSANILIDKNFRAKVADFGLTKLTDVGGTSLPTRVVGTFGYMPPEYARYADVSPKVDVYAFGVVLYELISAKEAIVRSTESASDSKGLVYLFEEALTTPDPKEGLRKLIDPRLGEDHSIDSILKMTHLAKACTQEDPKLRPTMRSVVVALMTLSSTSEFWDMNSLYENQGLVNLMSGR